ncbi:cysteine-rich RLK (RECEPTOR-like protein kinase) 8 [Hibiscus trionum]|uniref:Cysteine-rich RLK (RECEPTOR-like protein kinase) 8 n=1 Tax=Hibiscus trionum TaxID=183268 RepID=A0A9W7LK16_HIBTR|nr:cysteine-rich RLK (RECEPTOR-like protein kinase) 8 [Hibiscus trionum]
MSEPDMSDRVPQHERESSSLEPTNDDSAHSENVSHLIRRSTRIVQKPSYLQHHHCNNVSSSSCKYPVENHVSSSILSPDYSAFISNISSTNDPSFYHHAVKFLEWRATMDGELHAMETLQTWSVVPLPDGKVPIECKWAYRIKHNADGSVDRYKARLVAKLDVNNAFLNATLNEEVYMNLPLGYGSYGKDSNMLGFNQLASDHSLFVKVSGDSLGCLLVYVDDIIIGGKDPILVAQVQTHLKHHFKLKELGTLKYFLGFEIVRNDKGISLSQRHYALQPLKDTSVMAKKPVSLPVTCPHKLNKAEGELLEDPQFQFVSAPRKPHLLAAHRLLSYIKQTPGLGLFFSSSSSLKLCAFVDFDYSSCPDTRRSTTGYCTFLGGNLISWRSKKQHIVSRSSCEAEYKALASATCELVWLQALLSFFQVPITQAALYCDNQSALFMASNQYSNQLADVFTKALHSPAFHSIVSKLSLLNIHRTSS